MAILEERFAWLKEILDENPKSFAEYYKYDVANYLTIDQIDAQDLKHSLGNKFDEFNQFENKEDVRKFVDGITGYIVMKAQIEEIVADYLS